MEIFGLSCDDLVSILRIVIGGLNSNVIPHYLLKKKKIVTGGIKHERLYK